MSRSCCTCRIVGIGTSRSAARASNPAQGIQTGTKPSCDPNAANARNANTTATAVCCRRLAGHFGCCCCWMGEGGMDWPCKQWQRLRRSCAGQTEIAKKQGKKRKIVGRRSKDSRPNQPCESAAEEADHRRLQMLSTQNRKVATAASPLLHRRRHLLAAAAVSDWGSDAKNSGPLTMGAAANQWAAQEEKNPRRHQKAQRASVVVELAEELQGELVLRQRRRQVEAKQQQCARKQQSKMDRKCGQQAPMWPPALSTLSTRLDTRCRC